MFLNFSTGFRVLNRWFWGLKREIREITWSFWINSWCLPCTNIMTDVSSWVKLCSSSHTLICQNAAADCNTRKCCSITQGDPSLPTYLPYYYALKLLSYFYFHYLLTPHFIIIFWNILFQVRLQFNISCLMHGQSNRRDLEIGTGYWMWIALVTKWLEQFLKRASV